TTRYPHRAPAPLPRRTKAALLSSSCPWGEIPPCRPPATNCETLAGFSPQTAKPESLRRNTPETGVRYILFNKTVAVFETPGVRIGTDVMLTIPWRLRRC